MDGRRMSSGTAISCAVSSEAHSRWCVPSRDHWCCFKTDLLIEGVQVQMQVEAHFVSDVLRGNDTTEMRVTLIRFIEDEMPPDDE